MKPNELFPLESFPPRVREAILDEFEGRHPTLLEVACIPDAYWLATPAIGPKTLAKIQSLTREAHNGDGPTSSRRSDAELLTRHEILLAALKRIEGELKATGTELWKRGIDPLSTHVGARDFVALPSPAPVSALPAILQHPIRNGLRALGRLKGGWRNAAFPFLLHRHRS